MQEAISYKSYSTATATATGSRSPLHNFLDGGGGLVTNGTENSIKKLVEVNVVVVFGRRDCCMCHVVMRLLLRYGVNPAVFEVDGEKEESTVIDELSRIDGGDHEESGIRFPAVFMGGKLFGGLDKVMSTHISGELVPILNDAGALWP